MPSRVDLTLLSLLGYPAPRPLQETLQKSVGEVVDLPLQDYLTSITESVDLAFFPGALLPALAREKQDGEDFSLLLRGLAAQGQLDPIGCVVEGRRLLQGNGHHRLLASLLLRRPTIEVLVQGKDEELDFATTGDGGWFFPRRLPELPTGDLLLQEAFLLASYRPTKDWERRWASLQRARLLAAS